MMIEIPGGHSSDGVVDCVLLFSRQGILGGSDPSSDSKTDLASSYPLDWNPDGIMPAMQFEFSFLSFALFPSYILPTIPLVRTQIQSLLIDCKVTRRIGTPVLNLYHLDLVGLNLRKRLLQITCRSVNLCLRLLANQHYVVIAVVVIYHRRFQRKGLAGEQVLCRHCEKLNNNVSYARKFSTTQMVETGSNTLKEVGGTLQNGFLL